MPEASPKKISFREPHSGTNTRERPQTAPLNRKQHDSTAWDDKHVRRPVLRLVEPSERLRMKSSTSLSSLRTRIRANPQARIRELEAASGSRWNSCRTLDWRERLTQGINNLSRDTCLDWVSEHALKHSEPRPLLSFDERRMVRAVRQWDRKIRYDTANRNGLVIQNKASRPVTAVFATTTTRTTVPVVCLKPSKESLSSGSQKSRKVSTRLEHKQTSQQPNRRSSSRRSSSHRVSQVVKPAMRTVVPTSSQGVMDEDGDRKGLITSVVP